MASLKFEIKPVGELCTDAAELIRHRNDQELFGHDRLVYSIPEFYLLGYLSDRLITHLGILQRTILVGKRPLSTGGVGYLVTEARSRGQGYASFLMAEAVRFLKNELGLPFGLLTCKPRLGSLYEGMGWRTVAGPTVFEQADGVRLCGGLTMVFECGSLPWPDGKIDLCGLPW